MLHFASRPDPIFTAIIHEAMADTHRLLTDPDTNPGEAEGIWRDDYSSAAECFPLPLAVYTLDRLLAASMDPITVYGITDYHWLLLYDCLDAFCEVHNDYAEESQDGVFPVGPYEIGQIDFNAIVDHYFWDTDFLMDAPTRASLDPETQRVMGLSPETFGISQKLPPHHEELKYETLAQPRCGNEPLMEQAEGRRIPKYPAEPEEQ